MVMHFTSASHRRHDHAHSVTSAEGSNMASLRRPEPIHVSFVVLALSFASSSLPAFFAGRVYGTWSPPSAAATFKTNVAFETSKVPLVQPHGPQADRGARIVEVEVGRNILGPSFVMTPTESPSLLQLDRWPQRSVRSPEYPQAGNGRQVPNDYMAFVEHLVHPAMLTHDTPVRVAIVGDDEDAVVVKEVLKHATVRQVDVFELPGRKGAAIMNDSQPEDVHDDDPRVSRISTESGMTHAALLRRAESEGAYDVILWNRRVYVKQHVSLFSCAGRTIISPFFVSSTSLSGWASKRSSKVVTSSADESLNVMIRASAKSLSSNGLLCMTEAPVADDRESVPDAVERAGLESLVDYEYQNSRFWLAMKSHLSRAAWFGRNQAEAELSLRHRMDESALSSISSVDSATLMSHKFPSRLSEVAWCAKHQDECGSGHGFDPFVPNAPTDTFQVKHSGAGERAGRGIFARRDVPKGSTIGMDTCVYGMFLPPGTYKILTSMYLSNTTEDGDEDSLVSDALWKPVHGYVYGYGWVDSNYGMSSAGVDASILTFVNHGCNGTYNTGTELNVTEHTAVLGIGPAANGYVAQGIVVGDAIVYNPSRDRNYPDWGCDDTTRALRDISAGEELLDNYLVFGGSESGVEWEEVLIELKSMCSGGVGTITKYEESEGHHTVLD